MDRDAVLHMLRAHEPELKAAGIVSVSLFGSVARGDNRDDSDVDVVVRLEGAASRDGFGYFGRIEGVKSRLSSILGRPVDVVAEPVQKPALRRAIDIDGALAF